MTPRVSSSIRGQASPVRARRGSGRGGLLLLFVVLAGGCSASSLLINDFDEGLRELESRTVLITDELTLYSPYDVALSQEYLDVCLEQLALAARVVGAAPEGPVPVVLTPAEVVPGRVNRSGGVAEGIAGTAGTDGSVSHVRVFVPTADDIAFIWVPEATRRILRHEFAHVCLYGIDVPDQRWFSEGVATEVERVLVDAEGGWRVHPIPIDLITLLGRSSSPSVDELLAWSCLGESRPEQGHLYDPAWSLFRYASRLPRPDADAVGPTPRPPDSSLRDAIERVGSMDAEQLRGLQAGWQAWLAGFDVVGELKRLAGEGGESRRIAGQLLAVAAEHGIPQVDCAAADELALSLLLSGDERASSNADIFFVAYRRSAISPAALETLRSSRHPRAILVVQALHKRAGEPVDGEAVRAALAELPADRIRTLMSESVLRP